MTSRPVRHHLIIAGTGRAGTSFLVRFLTALGLDTDLSRHGEFGNWSEPANAGLERLPLTGFPDEAPYIIKSPWVGEYIDQIFASKNVVVDALITPIRDLVEAATSRSILEHHAIHRQHEWMANDLDRTWEVFGHTPGGSVFSLNPLDQARLLAVSFHRIIHSAASHDVPVIMPAFPRMVEDADYLYRMLRPVLPGDITMEQARAAHARVAAQDLVRVEKELRGGDHPSPAEPETPKRIARYPAMAEIDNIALRREIAQLRRETEQLKETVAATSIIPDPLPAKAPRSKLAAQLRQLLQRVRLRVAMPGSQKESAPDRALKAVEEEPFSIQPSAAT